MSFFLIIFGLLCLSAGQWSIARGRGGKRTTNGIITWLVGLLMTSSGLIGLFGKVGFLLILIIGVLSRTSLAPWIFEKIQKKLKLLESSNSLIDSDASWEELRSSPKSENKQTAAKEEVLPNNLEWKIESSLAEKNEEIIRKKSKIKTEKYPTGEKKISVLLNITYEDSKRNETNRTVKVISFNNQNYAGSFYRYCYLRENYTTFRFDRILDCANEETGEVIEDIQVYLNELFEELPKSFEDELLNNHSNIVKILYYVAKADGQFRKKEKEIIINYIQGITNNNNVSLEDIEGLFKKASMPSLKEYKYAWSNLFYQKNIDLDKLKECCYSIVNTQKVITPEEQEALDIIDEIINKNT